MAGGSLGNKIFKVDFSSLQGEFFIALFLLSTIEHAWYSPSAPPWIWLNIVEHSLRICDSCPTWPYPTIKVLAMRAKFTETSAYCTVINCTYTFRSRNVFGSLNFDYPSNTWRCTCNNIICRLRQGLWLHTQREDGANTTRLRPTQRNGVALWGQAAKADESVLARNQTKDSWTWNLAVSGSGKGTREWELTTRPSRRSGQLVAGDQERQLVVGHRRAERQAAELAWIHGGAVNTRHRAERRGGKIGSSEEESQDVWSQ